MGEPVLREMALDDLDLVLAAAHLFDEPPRPEWTAAFLAAPGHHLVVALDDAGRPVGFVSGIRVLHPDKAPEMLLYELGVDEAARGQGLGTRLVERLAEVASRQGDVAMWVLVDVDNEVALRTYRAAGGQREPDTALVLWDLSQRAV